MSLHVKMLILSVTLLSNRFLHIGDKICQEVEGHTGQRN